MQQYFINYVLKKEQETYDSEGIDVEKVVTLDNEDVLHLLESKPMGVFAMLDEELKLPQGSDQGFIRKVEKEHKDKTGRFKRDFKMKNEHFQINHFAGTVLYDATSFLDKNKDQLPADIGAALSVSSSAFIKKMFPPTVEEKKGARGAAPKAKTLGGQFKDQLVNLIDTLNATFPHFVRCLKPNDEKLPNRFNAGRMLDQLRYAGLLEVCRIRKLGYPVRRPFNEFFRRFHCIDLTANNLDALTASLTKKGHLVKGEWAKG